MSNFLDKAGDLLLKLALAGYLIMAFFVGMAKDPHSGSAIWSILEGALWPITLIVAWIRAT